MTEVQQGVYDIDRGSDRIRLIVLSEIPHAEHNAVWHLSSGIPEEVEFAAREYRGRTKEISTVLNRLFENYQLEGMAMSYTMEDFQKDYVRDHLGVLSPDEVLNHFSPEELIKDLSPDALADLLFSDRILEHINPEQKARLLQKLHGAEVPSENGEKRE